MKKGRLSESTNRQCGNIGEEWSSGGDNVWRCATLVVNAVLTRLVIANELCLISSSWKGVCVYVMQCWLWVIFYGAGVEVRRFGCDGDGFT